MKLKKPSAHPSVADEPVHIITFEDGRTRTIRVGAPFLQVLMERCVLAARAENRPVPFLESQYRGFHRYIQVVDGADAVPEDFELFLLSIYDFETVGLEDETEDESSESGDRTPLVLA